MRELSASALQIEEKNYRMNLMTQLAELLTREKISEMLDQNPKMPDSLLILKVKEQTILVNAFIHEYISRYPDTRVKYSTAKGYYDHFSKRLKPTFIEDKQHFHLIEDAIKKAIKRVREVEGIKEEKGNE